MASLFRPPSQFYLQPKINLIGSGRVVMSLPIKENQHRMGASSRRELSSMVRSTSVMEEVAKTEPSSNAEKNDFGIVGVHHVGLQCENLERSLDFYQNILGLKLSKGRPHHKLSYRGEWLWAGSEMIHLLELPNPDPRVRGDSHTCITITALSKLKAFLDEASIPYAPGRYGRPAVFISDPDGNALEFVQAD